MSEELKYIVAVGAVPRILEEKEHYIWNVIVARTGVDVKMSIGICDAPVSCYTFAEAWECMLHAVPAKIAAYNRLDMPMPSRFNWARFSARSMYQESVSYCTLLPELSHCRTSRPVESFSPEYVRQKIREFLNDQGL